VLNSSAHDYSATVSASGLTIVFASERDGSTDLYIATRATTTGSWSTPNPITELNTSSLESGPFLSPDELTIYFESDRPGSVGVDLYMATRLGVSAQFGAPVKISGVNTDADDVDPWLTTDLSVIFFASDRDGDLDIYRAAR